MAFSAFIAKQGAMPREAIRASSATAAFSVALVFAATSYSAALCALNALGIMRASNAIVAFCDAAIILGALAIALLRAQTALWGLFLALTCYFLAIALFSNNFDPKAPRDLLALIAFSAVGHSIASRRLALSAFLIISLSVVAIALFEFLAPSQFMNIFNIKAFYLARGVLDETAIAWSDNSLFLSGMRPQERMLFPALGPHRVSSIFLEPVSMGNFGAVSAALALSLGNRNWRVALAAGIVAAFAIVAADARFAALVVIFFVCARLIPARLSPLLVAAAPVFAIGVLIIAALSNLGHGDDLPTRLATSGRALLALPPTAWLGLGTSISTVDAGYAYAISNFGVILCMLAWGALAAFPAATPEGRRMKLMLAIYAAALLCVSGASLFALKTAALACFLLGVLAAPEKNLANSAAPQ